MRIRSYLSDLKAQRGGGGSIPLVLRQLLRGSARGDGGKKDKR